MSGLRLAVGQPAFREVCIGASILGTFAIVLDFSAIERCILLASLMLVMITELLNSAVEKAVDRIGLEHHELSKHAKDLGSAAVFVAMCNAGIMWGVTAVFR